MENKKGTTFTWNNLLSLLLAAAGIFLIVMFLWNLFYPVFDRTDERSESYFEGLERSISEVDSYGTAEYHPLRMEDGGYYLVYFGERARHMEGDKKFISKKADENTLCICSYDGQESRCDNCMELDNPGAFEDLETWAVEVGTKLLVKKGEESYEFTKAG